MTDKQKRLEFLKHYFNRLLQGVDKDALILAVEKLNKSLSKERQIVIKEKWNGFWNELWNEFGNELRNEFWNELGSELRNKLRNGFWNELGNEFWNELGSGFGSIREYYEQIWLVFVNEFYPQLKVFKKNKNKIEALKAICDAGNAYLFISKTKIYVFPFPKIKVDENKRLHSEIAPALIWLNKESYWLLGVKFDKSLWGKIVQKTITPKEIFAIENQEQKSIAMRIYGYDKMIEGSEAKVLSEKATLIKGSPYVYQVLEVDLKDDDVPARFVKVKDWSTERVYVLRVDPRLDLTKEPIGALAWIAGLEKAEDYVLEMET